MATVASSLADNPKKALVDFLRELREEYYPWYASSSTWHYRIWLPIHLIGLFSGFATAILAAIATEEWFKNYSAIRILLILLPALGTALTTVAVQSRLHERYQLREEGRRKIQDLWNEGRRRYAAATTPEDYTAIHAEMTKQVDQIEKEQSDVFFSLAVTVARSSGQTNEEA